MSSCNLLPLPSTSRLTQSSPVDLDYLFYSTSLFDFIDFEDLFGFSNGWCYDPLYAEIIYDDL
jgi:hypothetical protein